MYPSQSLSRSIQNTEETDISNQDMLPHFIKDQCIDVLLPSILSERMILRISSSSTIPKEDEDGNVTTETSKMDVSTEWAEFTFDPMFLAMTR